MVCISKLIPGFSRSSYAPADSILQRSGLLVGIAHIRCIPISLGGIVTPDCLSDPATRQKLCEGQRKERRINPISRFDLWGNNMDIHWDQREDGSVVAMKNAVVGFERASKTPRQIDLAYWTVWLGMGIRHSKPRAAKTYKRHFCKQSNNDLAIIFNHTR